MPLSSVIELLADLLDAHVAGVDVRYPRALAHPAHHGYLLANGVRRRKARLGEHDGQRHAREAAAAPHVEDARARFEAAHFGYGQRVEQVRQVELVEVLARDDVDLRIPVGVKAVKRFVLRALPFGQVGKIFRYNGDHIRSVYKAVSARRFSIVESKPQAA